MIHVTNGDSAAGTLRQIVDGPVLVTTDVLHEGPAPDVPLEQWYEVRARFLSDFANATYGRVRAELKRTDEAIAAAAADGSLVLWFEHDLYDQLLLIRALDVIARLNPGATDRSAGVFLVCIDRFPGVTRFVGLGQLTASQLGTLVGTERPVTPEQFALGSRAWSAFRASDPAALVELASPAPSGNADGVDALPFLAPALLRFLQEYPSTRNGLSRTANAVLRALAPGPLEGAALFLASQADEEAPFMGDWPVFDIVGDLSTARVPLVTIAPPRDGVDLHRHTIALTDAGRQVLEGRADAIALNGIDLWRGGVHLVGRPRWRWDEDAGRLVS